MNSYEQGWKPQSSHTFVSHYPPNNGTTVSLFLGIYTPPCKSNVYNSTILAITSHISCCWVNHSGKIYWFYNSLLSNDFRTEIFIVKNMKASNISRQAKVTHRLVIAAIGSGATRGSWRHSLLIRVILTFKANLALINC